MVRTATSALVSAALAGVALAAKFSPSTIPRTTTGFKNTVPNKFIVEVAEPADIPGKRSLDTRTVSLSFSPPFSFSLSDCLRFHQLDS